MTALDVSSNAGLVAMVLLTINILLGLILSARYNTVRSWPHKRLPIFDIHNWTAYLALGLIVLHPALLLFISEAKFRLVDLLWPVNSPRQPLFNCLGAAAFYSVLFVVVTSYFRGKLGSRTWKKLHYVSYAAAGLLFVHGLKSDPLLKDQPTDYLDGEKVLVEGCALVIVAATIWRIRYQPKKAAIGPSVNKIDYESA